jgi:hypothetical protein
MLLLIAAGLGAYVYLPLACAGKAPMQFGYARTWEGFVHVFTRGQYEKIVPTNVFADPGLFLSQLRWYLGLLNRQFVVPVGLLAVLPIVRVPRFRGIWLKWWGIGLLTFFMFSMVLLVGASPKGDVQDAFIQRVRFIPSFALWSIFIGLGFVMILDRIWAMAAPETGSRPAPAPADICPPADG